MSNILLNKVSIGYGTKVVASGLDGLLEEGKLTCLIGRNGAGKSTLMRTMTAFQPPLSGSIMIGDREVSSLTPKERARLIGIVLTEKPDVENMLVGEMVAMGRQPYTGFWGGMTKEDDAIVAEALRKVGMTEFRQRRMQTLSDGERQKVMIAKALAQQTPFIFLDEPTAFLDYPSKVDTMTMLLRLCHDERKAVLISTHDLDVALRHCDRIWMMKDARLLTGTAESLAKEIADFMGEDSCSWQG